VNALCQDSLKVKRAPDLLRRFTKSPPFLVQRQKDNSAISQVCQGCSEAILYLKTEHRADKGKRRAQLNSTTSQRAMVNRWKIGIVLAIQKRHHETDSELAGVRSQIAPPSYGWQTAQPDSPVTPEGRRWNAGGKQKKLNRVLNVESDKRLS